MRTNLYLKVELDHDKDDDLVKLAEQICRQIRKFYNVRVAELSSIAGDEN